MNSIKCDIIKSVKNDSNKENDIIFNIKNKMDIIEKNMDQSLFRCSVTN